MKLGTKVKFARKTGAIVYGKVSSNVHKPNGRWTIVRDEKGKLHAKRPSELVAV